jgi:hypothetical protein
VAHWLPDVALSGAAFEEDFAGFGVFRQQASLLVDQVKGAAVAGGTNLACRVVGDASPQLGRVAGVEVAVLDASEDVDVVHVLVSDGGWNHCWGAGGLLASASRAAGPVKSALSRQTTGLT